MATNYEGAEGLGAYPVFNTQSTVNLYGQLLQKKQAQQQAEQKAIADKLGRLNTKGLREQDKNKYYSGFERWRDLSQQADAERDKRKSFELRNEAEKQYQELLNLPSMSIEKTKRDAEIGKMLITKPWLLPKEQKERYLRSIDAETGSSDDISNYNEILNGHDLSKVQKDIEGTNRALLATKWKHTNPVDVPIRVGNKTGIERRRDRVVAPKDAIMSFTTLFDTNDGFRTYIEQQYPDMPWGEDEKGAKALAITDFVSKQPLSVPEKPEPIFDYKESEGDGSGRGGKGTEAERRSLQRQQLINDMFEGVAGSGEKLKAQIAGALQYSGKDLTIHKRGDGKINFTIPEIVTYKPQNDPEEERKIAKVIPKRQITIDPTKAEDKIKLNQFINETTGEKISMGQLLTEDGSKRVSGTKEGRDINKSGKVSLPKKESTGKSKTTSLSTIKSLVGKKGYEGYSEKELIDYYKSQGYTIK